MRDHACEEYLATDWRYRLEAGDAPRPRNPWGFVLLCWVVCLVLTFWVVLQGSRQ